MLRIARGLTGILTVFCINVGASAAASRPFTVSDEMQLAHFGDPYTKSADAFQFSPDGSFFAALIERGRIDLNRPEDTLRIYRSQDVLGHLKRSSNTQPPVPYWTITRSTDEDGPLITHWCWLKDSRGIAFLERGTHGRNQLVLADVRKKTIMPLTRKVESVKAFDIRDRRHYVYAVSNAGLFQKTEAEDGTTTIVGTGRALADLLYPVGQNPSTALWADRSDLWAVDGGKPFAVKEQISDRAIVLFSEGQRNLALSPDGHSLVTALALADVPSAWEQDYPPPYPTSPNRLRAGGQNLSAFSGDGLVSQYVVIDLRNGAVRALTDGPTGIAAGWDVGAIPAWSQDGKSIILPSVFASSGNQPSVRACVAVADLDPPRLSCVEPIQGVSDRGAYDARLHYVDAVRFEGPDGRAVRVSYYRNADGTYGGTVYRRTVTQTWVAISEAIDVEKGASKDLKVTVSQGLNDPPMLRATDSAAEVSQVIWDPNPQLKAIALGDATVLKWKDNSGRDWKGGLFKPVPYEPGHRYPLVIQTHGFSENEFRPSGVYPTAFAARALAGAGIAVLQVADCPIVDTPEEGACNAGGYEAAVRKLAEDGLVDPERVGIIGFSRSCFYVMHTLTASSLHVKAASVTDGVMVGYVQYLNAVDSFGDGLAAEYEAIVGAGPFGPGLQLWLKRSPLFNIDKVTAALQVVALGRSNLLGMWEPYAALRYLHKPVELILLNTDEHVLSNPSTRMASQGGSVDWFRFWLQDYEDPDPAKAAQYTRWHELRELQEAQDADLAKGSKDSTLH